MWWECVVQSILITISCIDFNLVHSMLYITTYCGLQLNFRNRLAHVNTALVWQSVGEFIRAFCIQVVWSCTRGDELCSADTNSPEGSYCLRCSAWRRICLSCWHCGKEERSTCPFHPIECRETAEVSERNSKFYKCLYIFQRILYICIYLFCFLLQNSKY